MDDQAGRLVDDGQRLVDVDDAQLLSSSRGLAQIDQGQDSTPAVTATSARLKAGQLPIWM